MREVLLLILCGFASTPVWASEIGNVHRSQEVDVSRRASAEAVEGLIQIFAALKSRELANVPEGREKLLAAAAALKNAYGMMSDVSFAADREVSLDQHGADSRFVGEEADELNVPHPAKLSEIYGLFKEQTRRLYNVVLEQADTPGDRPVIYVLGPAIARYIHLGEIVTRIGQGA